MSTAFQFLMFPPGNLAKGTDDRSLPSRDQLSRFEVGPMDLPFPVVPLVMSKNGSQTTLRNCGLRGRKVQTRTRAYYLFFKIY